VPGSVTLLAGEPGIGKSTLLLQALWWMADAGATCLYVTGEESVQQVRLRAERLGTLNRHLWLVSETSLPHIIAHVDALKPDVLAIDSIQTMHDPELGSAPGSVAQVRGCTHHLVQQAKARDLTTVCVGHVTKDGAIAGPRVLEHIVDTVLSFEGERHHSLRLLRALKHRFGGTHDLGLFEMADAGLEEVPDPSALFLTDRHPGVAGSVVAPIMDGQRPLLVEVQALVGSDENRGGSPRRCAQGLDPGRLATVLAVLDQRARVKLASLDVHALAAGGVRVVEPGADLALALALTSASRDTAIADDLVACGEIGLGGELRQVGQMSRRLAEAARLGFHRAIVPESAPAAPDGIELVRVRTLPDAIGAAMAHRPEGRRMLAK
jgi:DNA repair protein RadA/Sms